MIISVFGAGAIGSFLTVQLAQHASHQVQVVARGAQLEAIRSRGLQLLIGEQQLAARVEAHSDCRAMARPDVVLVTLKTHALAAAASDLAYLAEQGATMVFVCNGIPWWWGLDKETAPAPEVMAVVDPAGLSQRIDGAQVVGCVAYSPNTIIGPGVSRCSSTSSRFVMGPAHPAAAAACDQVASHLQSSGIAVPPGRNIRQEVWQKLLLNAALSPMAAVTGGNNQQITSDPLLRHFCLQVCDEVVAVAHGEGIALQFDPSMLAPDKLAPHKPSMLQDMEKGVKLETGSILSAVQVLARASGTPTPSLDLVSALVDARVRFRT